MQQSTRQCRGTRFRELQTYRKPAFVSGFKSIYIYIYIILIRPNLEPAIQNPCIYSVYTVLDLVGEKNWKMAPSGFHFSTGCIYSSLARKQESGISVLASTFRQCVYTVASMYPRIQNPATVSLLGSTLCHPMYVLCSKQGVYLQQGSGTRNIHPLWHKLEPIKVQSCCIYSSLAR